MPNRRCIWSKCQRNVAWWLNLPICVFHAEEVAQRVAQAGRDKDDAEANQAAVVVGKIDAGEALDPQDVVPGWVYYIRIGDMIKIGYAKDVTKRMRAYPPNAQLLAVEPGTLKLERSRHQHFGQHLAQGREWFTPNPELDAWVSTLRGHYGDPADKAYRFSTPTDGRRTPQPMRGATRPGRAI